MINDYYSMLVAYETGHTCGFDDSLEEFLIKHYSRYKAGEVVAVAQSYEYVYAELIVDFAKHNCHLLREVSAEKFRKTYEHTKGWMNKRSVKSELMPYQIRITNVHVEQLQDISNVDCIKEGVEEIGMVDDPGYTYPHNPVYTTDGYDTPQEAYASLINRMIGKGTWDSNPYVFVYDFELVK